MNHYINLAKLAVENYIKEGRLIDPPTDLPKEFSKKIAGVFVTIEKDNELRGCIGTYIPTRPTLAEEIIRNAVAAASQDDRFEPVKAQELPHLSYTVYILGSLELVEDLTKTDPQKFGIIVKTIPFAFPNQKIVFNSTLPSKTGLLLPGLDGIDTSKEQFAIACRKGQINPDKEKVFIYRFSAEKYQ